MPNKIALLSSQKILAILLIGVTSICALLAAFIGVVVNVVLLALVFGIAIFYLAYYHPQYSLVIMMLGAFLLPLMIKIFYLGDLPVGTGIEAINGLLVLTLIIRGKFAGWKSWPGGRWRS